jgi:hypothetical protein
VSTLRVALDLATRADRGAGGSRLRVGYALEGSRVAALVARDAEPLEVLDLAVDDWQSELAQRLSVPVPDETPLPPARVVELPWDLLVGTGAATTGHRPGVYDELAARGVGAVAADGRVLDLIGTHEQLRRLHHGPLARLQAVGSGDRPGRRRIGWTSWLLFSDGWRELTPYSRASADGGRRAMVRVEPRRPADLALLVARWAVRVRS